MKNKLFVVGGMMDKSGWNVVGDDDVRLIWKGDKDKECVYVKMKMKGKDRWFVFKGELKFSGIEEDDDE